MNLSFKLGLPPGSSGTLTSHSRVIAAVRSPLGFFVLALLIVESFLRSRTEAEELPAGHSRFAMLVKVPAKIRLR